MLHTQLNPQANHRACFLCRSRAAMCRCKLLPRCLQRAHPWTKHSRCSPLSAPHTHTRCFADFGSYMYQQTQPLSDLQVDLLAMHEMVSGGSSQSAVKSQGQLHSTLRYHHRRLLRRRHSLSTQYGSLLSLSRSLSLYISRARTQAHTRTRTLLTQALLWPDSIGCPRSRRKQQTTTTNAT